MALPRRRISAEKGLLPLGLARVSHFLSVSTCIFSSFLLALISAFVLFPSWHLDFSSTDPEDVDTVIKDVIEDTAAQAENIAAEESTKGATEDAAKGPAEEPDKGPVEEPGKGPAKEVVVYD